MKGFEGPCPACGEPLYGWLEKDGILLVRCEECGLGLTEAAAAEPPEALIAPGGNGSIESVEVRLPNRRSFQAGLGQGRWAAIRPAEQRVYATATALELLAERAGYELVALGFAQTGRAIGWMLQTILNGFTFRDNLATDLFVRREGPPAGNPVTFGIDATVSVLAAPIALLVAFPLELIGSAVGRGGDLVATLRRRPG